MKTDAKVVWLYISVNEMSVVDVLNSRDHLINQHEDCFQRKLSESCIEE
jgi:hypothetical protein